MEVLLEDRLRNAAASAFAGDVAQPPSSAAGTSILQAWSVIRTRSSDHTAVSDAIRMLHHYRRHLHLSDPHVGLLLSLLNANSGDKELSYAVCSILSLYARKNPRPNSTLLSSILSAASNCPPSHHSVLLFGSLSIPGDSRAVALQRLSELLDSVDSAAATADDSLPCFLAGVGYALANTEPTSPHFKKFISHLLRIHISDGASSLSCGLVVLSLFDWLKGHLLKKSRMDKIESICDEISGEKSEIGGKAAPFVLLMACCGILSSLPRSQFGLQGRQLLEKSIFSIAKIFISGDVCPVEDRRLVLRCIALGLPRCTDIAFDDNLIRCICLSLVDEVFLPLKEISRSPLPMFLDNLKEHWRSGLFKVARPLIRLLCDQYSSAAAIEESRAAVESLMWKFSRDIYHNLRLMELVRHGWQDEQLAELETMAEGAFLMIVEFASEVKKHRLNPKASSHGFQPEVSVDTIVAFSCVEFLRRRRLPEYTNVVRCAIETIQERAPLCISLIESLPAYADLTNQPDSPILAGMQYVWSKDDVQTARISFYLRVIPTFISLVPCSLFKEKVAPTMFLYLQHPNDKVTRAAHSVYVSFLSSGNDADKDDRLMLKEQLSFFYIRRTLEAYPEITPFDGLASGVIALVRHLSAGSPATSYCIHSLVVRANDLCKRAAARDPSLRKSWEGSTEPCKKLIDLLLRLISLVDIQLLPHLLQQVAQFIMELPREGREVVLDDIYTHVADSDDVTRKPLLVSWLQSLSYISDETTTLHLKSSPGATGFELDSRL